MKKFRVGFFKRPQGMFTLETIKKIEDKLKKQKNIQLFTDLDFTKAYIENGNVFIGEFNLNTLDLYFWHDTVKPTDWKGDNYFLNILRTLERNCLVINSSESTRLANDKFLAHTALINEELPVADFALVDSKNKEALSAVFEKFNSLILIKPRFGGWGTGIVKIDSLDQLFSTIELVSSFSPENKQIFIEKYYPNDASKWISVVVFGNKVLFGYRKKMLGISDWKVYDPEKRDGKGLMSEYVAPPEELKKIALSAKKAIGKDIIGFDFIFTDKGYIIIDENSRPGIYEQCLKKANINIENETVDLILAKLNVLKTQE